MLTLSQEVNTLAAELERAVRIQLGGRIHGLKILVLDNGILMEGRVDTFYAKQVAQQAVMASGCSILHNAIEVRG
jgi:hypothetical protein